MIPFINHLNLLKEGIITFYSEINVNFQQLVNAFNSILPFLVSLLTLFAIYIYYNKNKYSLTYKLENPKETDKSPKSVNNIIENSNSIFYILKYLYTSSFLLWIILFVILALAYYLFGLDGLKISVAVIISLQIFSFFKVYTAFYMIQIEEGRKNAGYISSHVILKSTVQLFMHFVNKIMFKRPSLSVAKINTILNILSVKGYLKNILYILLLVVKIILDLISLPFYLVKYFIQISICILIPSILILNNLIIFFIYELLFLFYYLAKCMPLYQTVNSMSKEPIIVNVELLSGDIVENMLLYQTTFNDYRFKNYNTNEEYIIPCSNVKILSQDYEFELEQLDNVTSQKYLLPIEDINLGVSGDILRMFLKIVVMRVMYRVWYRKAKIYAKMNDFKLFKNALEKAVESVKFTSINQKKNKKTYFNFISLINTDEEFNNLKENDWFIELINQPYEDTLKSKLTSLLQEYLD